MRKSLLIVMSVAILGGIGLYIDRAGSSQTAMPDTSSQQAAPAVSSANTGSSAQNTATPAVSANSSSTSSASSSNSSGYKDGAYVGSQADTIYGTVQVSAIISGGKITDVQFLKMPNDQQNSKAVAAMAEPQLKAEAIRKQSAHIDFVSGATQDSQGFEQSLQAALNQAAS